MYYISLEVVFDSYTLKKWVLSWQLKDKSRNIQTKYLYYSGLMAI